MIYDYDGFNDPIIFSIGFSIPTRGSYQLIEQRTFIFGFELNGLIGNAISKHVINKHVNNKHT